MQQTSWIFIRGSERLEITRERDDGAMFVVAGDGAPRSYFFGDLNRLEIFQRDMETLLLKTGWTFQAYAPDRRTGLDRRGWPRRSNDRRRWWTDGRSDDAVESARLHGDKTSTDERSASDASGKK